MNWLVNAEKFNGYPFQLCSCLVITKMVEQVPVSCLDLFQHQWVGIRAYGMDRQLGAASVQTVDHGDQVITFWSLCWDAASWRVILLCYITLSHFYIFPLLNITVFSFDFFLSLSVFSCLCVCVLLFIDSLLWVTNLVIIANMIE